MKKLLLMIFSIFILGACIAQSVTIKDEEEKGRDIGTGKIKKEKLYVEIISTNIIKISWVVNEPLEFYLYPIIVTNVEPEFSQVLEVYLKGLKNGEGKRVNNEMLYRYFYGKRNNLPIGYVKMREDNMLEYIKILENIMFRTQQYILVETNEPLYKNMIDRVGGLKRGEQKPVYPIKEIGPMQGDIF